MILNILKCHYNILKKKNYFCQNVFLSQYLFISILCLKMSSVYKPLKRIPAFISSFRMKMTFFTVRRSRVCYSYDGQRKWKEAWILLRWVQWLRPGWQSHPQGKARVTRDIFRLIWQMMLYTSTNPISIISHMYIVKNFKNVFFGTFQSVVKTATPLCRKSVEWFVD